MNNLKQRIFTGIILATLIISFISLGKYGFLTLLMVINLLGLLEFYRLFRSVTLYPRTINGILLAFALLFTCFLVAGRITGNQILLINIPLVFTLFICELYLKAENPFLNIAITLLGIICITVPLCFFLFIAFFPFGSGIYYTDLIPGIFFILWAGDSGAYLFGKKLGKKHLFLRISPNKTWEGSIGGSACALSVAYIISCFSYFYSLADWIAIASIIMVTGTFGDLVKSLMKRSLHVKDSGRILPGHGGILDRFDTLLSSAPFIFCYLILFRNA